MSEQTAYQRFRKYVIRHPDRIDRMENLIAAGTPDVNVCMEGVESWIEIKQPTEPKRADTPLFGSSHRLSQDQMNWIKRQVSAKGRVFVLIVTDKRWLLLHGRHADAINDLDVATLIHVSLFHHPTRMTDESWRTLRWRLTK